MIFPVNWVYWVLRHALVLCLPSRGWAEVGIGVLCQRELGAEWGLSPGAASTPLALSLQPGKLTEAFKYFLQGMGYSECQGWARGWRVPVCVCVLNLLR